MVNKITNWSYETPTEAGVYVACYGDVEVISNLHLIKIRDDNSPEILGDMTLSEVAQLNGYKFAKLAFGKEARE